MPRRPTASPSHFRRPLNAILASEGAVRVLREIVLQNAPLSVSVIAERAELSRAGAGNVLAALIEAGVVQPVGVGQVALYELVDEHPLAEPLRAVFLAEHERALAVLDGVRSAAASIRPEPVAVWLYGSVARREDTVGSDFDLAVVVDNDAAVERGADALREALEPLGAEQRVSFAVIGLSMADVKRLSAGPDPFWRALVDDARSLVGLPPEEIMLKTHHPS